MSPLIHGLTAWIIAMLLLKEAADRNLVTVCGFAPDIDGFGLPFSMDLYHTWHHTFGHSMVFALLLGVGGMAIAKDKKRVFLGAVLAVGAHLFEDIIGTNWGVNPFDPFPGPWLTFQGILSDGVIYGIIGPVFGAIIVVIALVLIYRNEKTPMELFSVKMDEFIVGRYIKPLKYKCACGKRAYIKCKICEKDVCAEHAATTWNPVCINCKLEQEEQNG